MDGKWDTRTASMRDDPCARKNKKGVFRAQNAKGETMRKYVYLLVTDDVDELPVACFDTVRAMARFLGKRESCISRAIMRGCALRETNYKPVRVVL